MGQSVFRFVYSLPTTLMLVDNYVNYFPNIIVVPTTHIAYFIDYTVCMCVSVCVCVLVCVCRRTTMVYSMKK